LPKEVQDLATRYENIIIDAGGGRDSVELRSSLSGGISRHINDGGVLG